MVIWVTGLSGSGKTTLCAALHPKLKAIRPAVVRLDGDEIRAAFGGDLGYAAADRRRQIVRIQRVAKIIADQSVDVLVGALYAEPDLLAWNRANLPGYFEIYLKADIEFLRGREFKALYSRALKGEIADVVGVDIPWQTPERPDLVIEAEGAPSADVLAERVLAAIPGLGRAPSRRSAIA